MPSLDNVHEGMAIVAINQTSVLECQYEEVLGMATAAVRPLQLCFVQLPGSHVTSGAAVEAVAKAKQLIATKRDAFAPKTEVISVPAEAGDGSSLDGPDAAKALFLHWDRNGDGSLSHSELKKAMKKDGRFKSVLASEGFHWKDVWSTYDPDSTGVISEAEFVRFHREV